MFNIIGKKWWYFIFSGIIIVPGLVSLLLWGLRPGIDFTGGTLIEFRVQKPEIKTENIQKIVDKANGEVESALGNKIKEIEE